MRCGGVCGLARAREASAIEAGSYRRSVDARRLAVALGSSRVLRRCRTGRDYQFYNWQMSVTRKPQLRPGVAGRRASRGFRSCTTRSAACGGRSPWALRRVGHRGALARRRRRRAAAAPLGRRRSSRAARPRRRQRAAVRVPDPRARRAGQPGARAGDRSCLKTPGASRGARRGPRPGHPLHRLCVAGPVTRLPLLEDVYAHVLKLPVRLAAAGAARADGNAAAVWPRLSQRSDRGSRGPGAAPSALTALAEGWNIAQFADWAAHRTYKNYEASRASARCSRRNARPGQARQRPGARESHPADLRRPPVRQLHRPKDALGCAVYFDVYRPGTRL